MYQELEILRYRGIQYARIEQLAPVNLVVGKNGAGKSTVLEAFWLHSNPALPDLLPRTDAFRSITWEGIGPAGTPSVPWKHLFYGFDTLETVEFRGATSEQRWSLQLEQARPDGLAEVPLQLPTQGNRLVSSNAPVTMQLLLKFQPAQGSGSTLKLSVLPDGNLVAQQRVARPLVECSMLSPFTRSLVGTAARFGALEVKKRADQLMDLVHLVDPRVLKLTAIPQTSGGSRLFVDIGQPELLPVEALGSGVDTMTAFGATLLSMNSGLLLIDEIDNGIHYSVLEKMWTLLYGLAQKNNVQIIATTHSKECIQAAAKALPNSEFLLHRMINEKDHDVSIRTFEPEALEAAMNMDIEVR